METFISRYVFPGSFVPSINHLTTAVNAGSKGTLEVETVQNIGLDYAKTLLCWKSNFIANWDSIRRDFLVRHKSADDDDVAFFRRRWLVSDAVLPST
jgi:cyclopropane-fatty-acyl-phospholipid synthase